MKASFCLWFPLVLLCACVKSQDFFSLSDVNADGTKVRILVRLSENNPPDGSGQSTRSSWPGQPDRVESFLLMAYRNGILDGYTCSPQGTSATITLFKGRHYQLYALANVPDFEPPMSVSELEDLSLPLGDFQQSGSLPMACRVDDFQPLVPEQTLSLAFERLFARLVLRLDKGAWGMLRVGHVRLRQAAAYVHPFAETDAGFSHPVSSSIDGDAATETDLQRLNAGDSLILYVPQNRQGTLLPGNDNPYLRVPDWLGEKADQCTYLEVSASQEGETLLAGDALCRVYLGCNAADNFDVPGNTSLHLTLFLTDRLMEGDWGWRIDSDLAWQPDVVTAWLAEGMHPVNDLYVGEVFRYAVQPSDAFLEMIGGDFSRCSLCFRSADVSLPTLAEADTTLLFSSWTSAGGGVWYADAHCRKPADSGRIRLCLDGKELFDLTTGLNVRVPSFFLPHPSDVPINAEPTLCPLDLRDRQGLSLANAYGFDVDLFTPEYALSVPSEVTAPPVSSFSRLSVGPPTPTAPFGACAVGISHTGSNEPLSRFLTESLQRDGIFNLQVRDARYAVAASCPIRTDIQTIRVRLRDEGTSDSDWSLCVDNPSALPLDWGLVAVPSVRYEYEAAPPSSCRKVPVIDGPGTGCIFANREKASSVGIRDSVRLMLSPSEMAGRCQSCGYRYEGCEGVGLEPALCFGTRCDARLDGKIELDCALSDGTPVSCLFASASETCSRAAPFAPVWMRYSAYDDLGEVRASIGFSSADRLPTVSIQTDLEGDERLFTAAFYGYINGSVYGRPANPRTHDSIQFYPHFSFVAVPERMFLPDGQARLCSSGNFLTQYQQILQYEWEPGPIYTYSAWIQEIEFGLSVNCEPVNRIYSPLVSGSLHHSYYSSKQDISFNVGSVMTGVVQDMLYLF